MNKKSDYTFEIGGVQFVPGPVDLLYPGTPLASRKTYVAQDIQRVRSGDVSFFTLHWCVQPRKALEQYVQQVRQAALALESK